MDVEKIFWLSMAILVLVVLPIAMIASAWQHLRAKRNGSASQQQGKSRVAIGNALQEIDRLVARPAIEFTVEAERPIVKRENDAGGD